MSLRWDDHDDVLEDHGQHVPDSLHWYEGWDGLSPQRKRLLAALGEQRVLLAEVEDRLSSLSSRLLVAPEGPTAGSSPARGLPLCVVCDDLGCEFCPKAAA